MELIVDIRKKFKGFNLEIGFEASNGVMGILGASGSGKSMTLRCIAGIETPDSGRIVLNGKVLFDSERNIDISSRERKVGFLFQNYALFPHMTVEQNIGFALGGLSTQQRAEKVRAMITMMKLEELEKRYPSQLSGGQQQRVALARALAVDPEVLLLDEPFSALDEYLRSRMVKQLMDSLSGYAGVTLFVTHNMEEAYRVCRKLIVMHNGRKEACGDKEEIFNRPPSLSAAQVTGCKNISAAKQVSEGIVDAVDWGCMLKAESASGGLSHIGIRANHIRLADDISESNVFDCWPAYTSEAPFRTTVYLSLNKPAAGAEDYQIQWEMSKERWMEIRNKPLPWKISLNPEKLIRII